MEGKISECHLQLSGTWWVLVVVAPMVYSYFRPDKSIAHMQALGDARGLLAAASRNSDSKDMVSRPGMFFGLQNA